MKTTRVSFSETGMFPELLTRYLAVDAALRPFYRYKPEITSFAQVIADRRQKPVQRQDLHDALVRQYGYIQNVPAEVQRNITSLLQADTFTITTGHQLNIFTGPLYCMYKVMSTIRLSQQLNEMHPECKFVPVFWMASEDHDLAEIDHFKVYGKEFKWEHHGKGASGRLSTQGLNELCDLLQALLGEEGTSLIKMFRDAYDGRHHLAGATRMVFNALFGHHGLVVLDGDDAELKRLFAPTMMRELTETVSFDAMTQTNVRFAQVGKIQVNPRSINLFYLNDGLRERIERDGEGRFHVVNTQLSWDLDGITQELQQHPERFSPNVVLRPVYQETILPNIAYIGGPGELNYWLQLKDVFEAMQVFYPMVLMRSSFTLLDDADVSRMEKLGFTSSDLFHSQDALLALALSKTGQQAIDFAKAIQTIILGFDSMKADVAAIDPTLVATVEAEKAKAIKSISILEEKAHRAVKRKNEQVVTQIAKLKGRVAPNGVPQERSEGMPGFHVVFAEKLIEGLLPHASPFEATHFVVD